MPVVTYQPSCLTTLQNTLGRDIVWKNRNCSSEYDTIRRIYSVSQKSSPPKTFCNIFTQVKNISMKFCQYADSLYLHIFTDFCRFILIFNHMALNFLGVPIVLTFLVSSLIKSDRRNFIVNNEWFPVHPTSIHWIIRFEDMLESYYKLQPKLKQFPSLQVIHFTQITR